MKKPETVKPSDSLKHAEWWFLVAIAVIILVTIFALTNADTTPVRFLFWQTELSLALLIFLSAAIGAVIGISFGLLKQLKNRKVFRNMERQLADLEKEKRSLEAKVVELENQIKKEEVSTNGTDKKDEFRDDEAMPEFRASTSPSKASHDDA